MASNNLGSLIARLTLKGVKDYKKGLKDAEKGTKKVSKTMLLLSSVSRSLARGALASLGRSMATFVTTGLKDFVTGMIDARNALNDASARSGVAAGTIQALGLAFEASGQDAAEAGRVLNKWPQIMAEAMKGTGEVAEGFKGLGIEVNKTSDSTEVLETFIERIQAIEDPTQRSVAAIRVLGRGGTKLMQALAQNAPLKQLVEFTERYGTDVGPKASAEASRFQQAMATLKTTIDGVKESILQMVGGMEGFVTMINIVGQALIWVTSFVQALIDELKAGFSWMTDIGRAMSALASGDIVAFGEALSDAKDSFSAMVRGGLGVGAIARAFGTAAAETQRYTDDLINIQDAMDGVLTTAEGFDGVPGLPGGDDPSEDKAKIKRMNDFQKEAFALLELLKQGGREADALSLLIENTPADFISPAMIERLREFDERVREFAPPEALSSMDEMRLLLLDLELAAAGAGEQAGLYGEQIAAVQDAIKAEKWEKLKGVVDQIGAAMVKGASAAANLGSMLFNALENVLGLDLSISALFGLAQTGADGGSARGAVVQAVKALIDGAIAAVETIAANLPVVINTLVQGIPQIVDAVVSAIPTIINALVQGIPLVVEALVSAIPLLLDALMAGVPALIQSVISGVVDLVMSVISQLPGFVADILAAIPEVLTQLLAGISDIIQALLEAIPGIIDGIIAALPDIILALIDGLLGIVIMLVEQIPLLITALIERIPDLIGAIVGLIPVLIASVIEAIPDIITGLARSLPSLIPVIITLIPSIIVQVISSLIESLPTLISALVVGLIQSIPELIVGLIQGIKDAFGSFVSIIGDIFREALGFLGDVFGGGEDGGKGLIGRTVDAIGSAFSFTGRDFIPATMRVTVHPGERIVSADENSRNAAPSRRGSGSPPAPPLPSGGGGGDGGSTEIAVMFDGRMVAASQVRAMQQGRAPGMQRMMRKRIGVKIGFNRGKLNKWNG